MSHDLTSVKIATLVAAGFEQDHVLDSQEFLHQAGATVTTVSAGAGTLPEAGKAGKSLANIPIDNADETGFDALLLPGGKASADNLSQNPTAIDFVHSFVVASKPIGAIAEGIKVLVAADGVAGRRIAANPDLRGTIEKAGGVWKEQPVASDRQVVTAADIQSVESFCDAFAQSCTEQKGGSGSSLHTD
ncbi:MAG: DJ-1/PfpI family protein [Verrucomicrobia bacterium]|nr:DJ-1/PfpI family protein [Verrucomicrobiota bacterium]MBV8277785.1 DJ-1/PfpI family protein [Verrucomicrobiota bacterium]